MAEGHEMERGRLTALYFAARPRYNTYSSKRPMETWSLFTGNDIAVAALGMLGLVSVVVVVSTAANNVTKREISLRNRKG